MTRNALAIAGNKPDWSAALRALERKFANGEIFRPEFTAVRDLIIRCVEIS